MADSTWPTAEKINQYIEMKNSTGSLRSPATGLGSVHLQLSEKYGVHPVIIIGTITKECSYHTVPDNLRDFLNFGGNTYGGTVVPPACGHGWKGDRDWLKFCTPEAGIEGVYVGMTNEIMRTTDGTLGAILEKYSPSFENDPNDMFAIYREVGMWFGVDIGPNTQVFGKPQDYGDCLLECMKKNPIPGAPQATCIAGCSFNSGKEVGKSVGSSLDALGAFTEKLPEYFARATLVLIGTVILGFALYQVIKAG